MTDKEREFIIEKKEKLKTSYETSKLVSIVGVAMAFVGTYGVATGRYGIYATEMLNNLFFSYGATIGLSGALMALASIFKNIFVEDKIRKIKDVLNYESGKTVHFQPDMVDEFEKMIKNGKLDKNLENALIENTVKTYEAELMDEYKNKQLCRSFAEQLVKRNKNEQTNGQQEQGEKSR